MQTAIVVSYCCSPASALIFWPPLKGRENEIITAMLLLNSSMVCDTSM